MARKRDDMVSAIGIMVALAVTIGVFILLGWGIYKLWEYANRPDGEGAWAGIALVGVGAILVGIVGFFVTSGQSVAFPIVIIIVSFAIALMIVYHKTAERDRYLERVSLLEAERVQLLEEADADAGRIEELTAQFKEMIERNFDFEDCPECGESEMRIVSISPTGKSVLYRCEYCRNERRALVKTDSGPDLIDFMKRHDIVIADIDATETT